MSFVIALAVVLVFAGSVGAAVCISIGRAAALGDHPAVGLYSARK